MPERLLAEQKWSPTQRAMFVGIILGCIALACIDLALALWVFSLLLLLNYSVIVLCKVLAALFGLNARFTIYIQEDTYQALTDDELPIYTILLPLYKESEVVEKLVAHIGQLDYPKEKLDVKVLLEENDDETLQAITAFGLPNWCELIIVPDLGPKTKPRACNVGLQQARGEFCVIFDAEDQPEPDQLKKVICAYKKLPEQVVCLQAKLNFFNAKEGLLPRCFALEYTTWFDLYLPGLHALRAPIPLGGTSNHFKTTALKELQGWDSYNVTEDCDLGIRIAEAGYSTRIIDSVTWEEAPRRIPDWVGQRSRWIKGYFQTFWVHTRQPIQRLKHLGLWGFFQMLITVGGQVACVILNPICWIVLLLWLYWQWPIIYVHSPYTLTLFAVSLALFQFNALFIGIHLIAAIRRRKYALIPYVILLPFYWILVSIGAWRGVLEFFWSPYKWVKTTHGMTGMQTAAIEVKQLATDQAETKQSAFVNPISQHGFLHKAGMTISILGLTALISMSSIMAPAYFGYTAKVEQARIALTGNYVENEQTPEQESWFAYRRVTVELALETKTDKDRFAEKDLRLLFFLKVRDGEWFHKSIDSFQVTNNIITVDVPLNEAWDSVISDFPWDNALLSRVRSFGVKAFHNSQAITGIKIHKITPQSGNVQEQAKLDIRDLTAPQNAQSYEVIEAKWTLNKSYANHFDTDLIYCDAVFTHESGTTTTLPAFYTQDYHQYLSSDGEQLIPKNKPYWCARFSPTQPGTYTWHITGKDHNGHTFRSEDKALHVQHRAHRGFLGQGENPRYFAFENGDYFYPLAINIRSPRDEINHDLFSFQMPAKETGTYVLFDFINKMKSGGINMGRVWMSPWYGGIEWNAAENGFHGLGVYNLQNAYRLDSVLKYAAKHDILIELALNHHGPFTQQYDSQWKDNPYNSSNGGPAKTPRDVLPNETSRSYFKKRLRYIAARYGAYPNLFAYTLWIEANVVDPRPPFLVDWHKEFGPFMNEVDAHRHLVSTEFNNRGYPPIWSQKDIEYTQVAAYNFGRGNIHELMNASRTLKPYKKPALVEEYMGLPAGGHEDVLAHEFHDGLWANFMLPLSGAPMPWWWNFIFEKDLHLHYNVFAKFIEGENLAQHTWDYKNNLPVQSSSDIKALGRFAKDRAFIWVYKDTASNIRFSGRYHHRRELARQAYRKHIPKTFSPIDQLTGKQDHGFMSITNAKIIIPATQLQTGRYRLETWDTWQSKEPELREISIDKLPYHLALPTLSKDIAIKLKAID